MVFRDNLFFKDPSLTLEILLVIFLAAFLLIFNKFIKDIYIIFRRPLSPEELYKQYKSEIESLISQGKYTEAYKLACKWDIQEFFDWPEHLILIVFVVNDLLKEGKYYQAYTMALSIGILDCWYWPYVPLPDDLEAEQGGDSERGNGELVGR